MEKVYSGYELEVNKNVEDIAYNGRMLKIEGNSKQKIIEEVKGKEVTGEFITVNDVELEDGRITVSGNSKQETSKQGKNMLDVAIFDESTSNGITLTRTKGTNKVTLNGTTTTSFTIHSNDLDISQFEVGKTYTLSISTDKCKYSFEVFENDSSSASIWSNSITMQSTYTRIRTYLQRNSAVTFDNEEIALQFEAGEATEIEDFTPDMPSPDYPSEVESCGDNINIFDKDKFNNFTNNLQYIELTLKSNTKYTMCSNIPKGTGGCNLFAYKKGETASSSSNFVANGENRTVTTGDDGIIIIAYRNYNASLSDDPKNDYKYKLVEGTEVGEYSNHGQGCINEVICNKNIFNKNDVVEDYFVSSSIVSNSSWCYNLSQCFKTGKKYTTSGGRCILSYFNGDTNISYQDITNGIITIPENTTKVYISTLKTNLNILQIEEGSTATPYVEHKSQAYTIPTQQPFRAIGDIRDTFIKKNNKWFERHWIPRYIFTGNEEWKFEIVNGTNSRFTCEKMPNLGYTVKTNVLSLCNAYSRKKEEDYYTYNNAFILRYVNDVNRIDIIDNRFDNIDDFKSFLQERYNVGTPIYVDYVLETPIDIECTEEQNAILNQLYNTTIYIPTTNIYSTDKIAVINKLKYNYVLPSPSPEVPSEVESCGDNINLYNAPYRENNKLIITATQDDYYKILSYYAYLEAGKKYRVSFESDGSYGRDSGTDTIQIYLMKDKSFDTIITIFSKNEIISPTVSGNYYIRADVNKNGKSHSFWNFKIKKGSTETGEYSPYGQGCINEVICNKNILPYIEKVNSAIETGVDFYGITYFQKVKPSTTYTISIIDNYSTGLQLYEYDDKKQFIRRITPLTGNSFITSENTKYFKFRTNALVSKITNPKFMLEESKTLSDYIEHQEQVFTIPTQQPFRAIGDIRDEFIKKNNKWYERHYIQRVIFDGTEDWYGNINSSWSQNEHVFAFPISGIENNGQSTNVGIVLKSTHFKCTNTGPLVAYAENAISYYPVYKNGSIMVNHQNISNVTDFKAWLTEQYNAGTPVYVDYVLETPLDIECTPEQEIKLEKIQNIKLYDGINYIYSLDDIEALLTFEYYYKMKDYDFYLSADGYLNIPSLGIRYLVDLNESSISTMPEAVESSVRVAGRDGDVVLNTTYEPIPFNIVCYTEDNLTAMEKTEQEIKINSFLNSIKNRTKRFAIERNTKFYEVKYNGALTTINFPKFLKFSIPFKSSDSYGKDIVENIMIGNEKVNSNTIKEVGALITIKGPAISPIIALNDYSIEYSTDIIDGARIEIDTNKSTVTHINSDEVKTNVMKYYNHQFPKIENGENELKILSGIDDNNRVNIKWNDLKL